MKGQRRKKGEKEEQRGTRMNNEMNQKEKKNRIEGDQRRNMKPEHDDNMTMMMMMNTETVDNLIYNDSNTREREYEIEEEEKRQYDKYDGTFYFGERKREVTNFKKYVNDEKKQSEPVSLTLGYNNEMIKDCIVLYEQKTCYGFLSRTIRMNKNHKHLVDLIQPTLSPLSPSSLSLSNNDEMETKRMEMEMDTSYIEHWIQYDESNDHYWAEFDENPYKIFQQDQFHFCKCNPNNIWKRKWHLEWALTKETHNLCLDLFYFFKKQCNNYGKYNGDGSDKNFCHFLENFAYLFISGQFVLNEKGLIWVP